MPQRIYTRTGDTGQTSLLGGTRVSKSDPRLDTYGTVDELNAHLGVTRAFVHHLRGQENLAQFCQETEERLQDIQSQLFNIGSHLACEKDKFRQNLPHITEQHILNLEQYMDSMTSSLPELRSFILPGGTVVAAQLHIARTVCRRAERHMISLDSVDPLLVRYINRLSDYLFVLARYANHQQGEDDIVWKS